MRFNDWKLVCLRSIEANTKVALRNEMETILYIVGLLSKSNASCEKYEEVTE